MSALKRFFFLPYSSGGDGTSKPAEHLCKLDAECGPGMRCSRTVNDKGIAYGVCVKKS